MPDNQPLRRGDFLMVFWAVRVLIWLLVICVPAQASLVTSLRARGPAHAHVEVPGAARWAAQATAEHDAEHAAWHAHEHEHERGGFRAAHHDHDAADNSVVPIASPGDDGHGAGAGGGTGKATAIEMPGLLPSALDSPIARAERRLSGATAVAFASQAASPLYRPPR